jgi:hypothetical protein
MKPALISTCNHGDKKILIVTIRGTATAGGYMLNTNGAPETFEVFGETTTWHRGFLSMTLRMRKDTAKVVQKVALQDDMPEHFLFTGHSAGGVIAQIFYSLSMRSENAVAKVIQGEHVDFENFHAKVD